MPNSDIYISGIAAKKSGVVHWFSTNPNDHIRGYTTSSFLGSINMRGYNLYPRCSKRYTMFYHITRADVVSFTEGDATCLFCLTGKDMR